jgi:hypothetical protein
MINRIEVELSRHLKPSAAPDELWRSVETGLSTKPQKPRWLLWSVAAAVAATSAFWYFSFDSDSTSDLAKAAWRELASGSGKIDFRSNDPVQIRAWIEAHAGLDIPLASAHSVEFIGATLLKNSPCVACVSYRIGKEKGELLVSRGILGGPKHPAIRKTSYKGTSLISWAASGQTYAIATTKEGQHSACVLCHDGKRSPMPPSAG